MSLEKEDGFEPLDPTLIFTEEEIKVRSEILPKLSKASEEFATKYVLGTETGDAAWNEWLKKTEELGVDKILKIYNDAQARYNKK